MYHQMYIWMNQHFLVISVIIIFLMFVLAIFSAMFRENRYICFIYNLNVAVYILALLFLTVGSRNRYDAPILDLKLHLFHLEKIWQKDAWILHGDIGNVVLFFPFGMISQKFLGHRIRWYGCAALGGGLSICIEVVQYVFRCGYCDINDLLYNLIGVLLGYCLGWNIQNLFIVRGFG